MGGGGFFAVFWALAGQTTGMRFLSFRLMHNASEITAGCAVRRVLALILALLPFGLGYFAILRDPQRRAWHDRLTGTEVIYDLVARSAPHAGAGPSLRGGCTTPSSVLTPGDHHVAQVAVLGSGQRRLRR